MREATSAKSGSWMGAGHAGPSLRRLGMEKSAAKKAIDVVFAGIVDAAKNGEEVNLPGFGRFKVKDSPAHQGRNPAMGETIEMNRPGFAGGS